MMMLSRLLLAIVFTKIFSSITIILAVRSFNVRWLSAICEIGKPEDVEFFNCLITELPNGRGNYIDFSLRFRQDVSQISISFRISMPRQKGNGTEDVVLLKIKTDGCRLFHYQTRNIFFNAIVQEMMQSSNFPKKCPLRKHENYYIKHYALNPDHFPPFAPEMNFSIESGVATDQMATSMIVIKLSAGIVQKSKKQ